EELVLAREALQRVDGVRGAAALELDPRDRETRLAGDRQLEHPEAIVLARDGRPALQRRALRDDEHNAVERYRFEGRLRDRQVPDVHRIERATEHPEPHLVPPSVHSISVGPMRTVSPSLTPSRRSSFSMPFFCSRRWK